MNHEKIEYYIEKFYMKLGGPKKFNKVEAKEWFEGANCFNAEEIKFIMNKLYK